MSLFNNGGKRFTVRMW